MKLITELPHKKYGSVIFCKMEIQPTNVLKINQDNIERLTIEKDQVAIISIYKPPAVPFKLPIRQIGKAHIFIVDFNSHHQLWGYDHTNSDGKNIEFWAENNKLQLIHDPKVPKSLNSGRWKKNYNTDLCFVSEGISPNCKKRVCNPIPKSQHQPIGVEIKSIITSTKIPFRHSFNFKKANWHKYGPRHSSYYN